jgi:hypothetical protein
VSAVHDAATSWVVSTDTDFRIYVDDDCR